MAITALRQTMDSITTDKVPGHWLQQGIHPGSGTAGLYRHLIRPLETHGVTPVGFNVVHASSTGTAKAGGAYVRQRPAVSPMDRRRWAPAPVRLR